MIRSVTLPCGAVLEVVQQNEPGARMFITLGELRVASVEQAREIIDRPARRVEFEGGAYATIAELPDGTVTLSGLGLTKDEAQAMLNGYNPILVLLPPGELHAVPVDMREIWEVK